jgi:hypothetical protein
MPTYAEQTRYNTIFKRTYWGNFQKTESLPEDEIVNNRNDFVETNDIARYYPTYPRYLSRKFGMEYGFVQSGRFWDHIEVYTTNPGDYIVVSSPYGNLDETVVPEEFSKIAPIYSTSATSYMAKFKKRSTHREKSPKRK